LLFRRIISATPAETPTRENQNQKEENGTEINPKESSLAGFMMVAKKRHTWASEPWHLLKWR
jgi:hypothetical protein